MNKDIERRLKRIENKVYITKSETSLGPQIVYFGPKDAMPADTPGLRHIHIDDVRKGNNS